MRLGRKYKVYSQDVDYVQAVGVDNSARTIGKFYSYRTKIQFTNGTVLWARYSRNGKSSRSTTNEFDVKFNPVLKIWYNLVG